jgi:hypothetical protein
MTDKIATTTWHLTEQHGLWWAYEGELPASDAFQTHRRPRHVPILGPYPSRAVAEALLRRRLHRHQDDCDVGNINLQACDMRHRRGV